MNEKIGSGTAVGLMAFLDQMADKGWVSKGAIIALKTATRQVIMSVDGEEWEKTDVRSLDINDYITRFGNKTIGKYNSQSIDAYKRRLTRAIGWYEKFITNPGWVPNSGKNGKAAPSNPTKTAPKKLGTGTPISSNSSGETGVEGEEPQPKLNTSNLITYPFPLHSGEIAYFYLPASFSKVEAERMSSFLLALSLD